MQVIPITIWREARGEGQAGMAAVLHVILNRAVPNPATPWPADPEKVCLQDFQFSCWNNRDPQRNLYPAPNDPQYAIAESLALSAARGLDDPTNGATAYYDESITAPSWATPERFTVQIGRLRFYRL
jgi:N-acetylmuramoyl-L-alanine amidase